MSKLFNSPITQKTRPQASGLPLPTWRVRLSNGAVYGPIELDELRTWAEECRLAPGDQVSSDKGHWANAETLPELRMQWMVEMASGEIFGPVHLNAVVDFFHSRLVLPSSRLANRVTGKKSTVADLVLPLITDAARDDFLAGAPVVADNAPSADRLIKFNQNTSTTRLPPDQYKEKLPLRIEKFQATVDESESRIKQLQSALDYQQAQTLKLRDDKAALEQTYLGKLGNAQENYDAAANALEKAEAQVQALRADQVRLEKELGDRISSLSSQIQDSLGQIAEKNNIISRLETEITEKNNVINRLETEFIKARGDSEAGMLDIQDRLSRATSNYDSTLNNLREKESSLRTAVRERDLALQSARTLTERYEARAKAFDVQIGELVAHQQTSTREIEMRQTKIERLNAALAEKEQHWAKAARDWDSFLSKKESRIQTLTRQIEVLTADQPAMRSALEQNRAEFEPARPETQKLATRANELNERISVFDSQAQNVSENLAASEDAVAGQRERIEAMTGEHLQKETQLQTIIEELTGRRNALNSELETMQGELTGREADIKGTSERLISTENSVTEAGNEAEQLKIRCQGLQEQREQTEGEFKRREMLRVTEKAVLERGYPGHLEIKNTITPVPDRQKMNRKSEKKVLVVDDSEVIQQLITKLVEKHGASVTAVASARDVTGILAEKACRFDLFVLDLILPETTGWEILDTLRARPDTKDTPIVILTGPLSPKEKENMLQKANAVIEKSKFTLTDFNKVLNQWL